MSCSKQRFIWQEMRLRHGKRESKTRGWDSITDRSCENYCFGFGQVEKERERSSISLPHSPFWVKSFPVVIITIVHRKKNSWVGRSLSEVVKVKVYERILYLSWASCTFLPLQPRTGSSQLMNSFCARQYSEINSHSLTFIASRNEEVN